MHIDRVFKRSEILRDVEWGRLDISTAQASADELGIGPLLPTPNLASPLYDPLQEPRWTLMMAVTWVGFRRMELVQKYWTLVRARTGKWVRSASGYVVAMEDPVWLHAVKSTLHDDEFADASGLPQSFTKGWQLLRQKLAAGTVRGYGRDLTAGPDSDVIPIPRENWNSLAVCSASPNSINSEDGLRMRYSEAVRYLSIEIEQSDLLSVFRADAAPSNASAEAQPPPSEPPVARPRRGRKPGTKNWDATDFMDEYRLGLEAYGKPGKQNLPPWDTLAAAADHVLGIYTAGLPSPDEHPSISAAKEWGNEAIAAWEAAGRPRNSDNSGNSDKG